MKKVDHYISRQFLGPFLVGVAAFIAILMGIDQMYQLVQLVVRDGVPVGLVAQVFLLRLPTSVALTMPMAALFAALMASGELSSHGEMVAMRAGGLSVWRMAAPVCIAGCIISLVAFGFNEAAGPPAGNRAATLVEDYLAGQPDLDRPLMLRIPEEGAVQRLVYADRVSVPEQAMMNVSIIEFDRGEPREVFFAESARWQGEEWLLTDVIHKQDTGRGYREQFVGTLRYDIGRSMEDVKRRRARLPQDMTLQELRQEVEEDRQAATLAGAIGERSRRLLQHMHIRLATPWAALCFAVLGFPLGMRPQRTSAGVGFGISLAIVFLYYIVINVLRAFGEQGALSPAIAAWTPNALVLGVGVGMMVEAAR